MAAVFMLLAGAAAVCKSRSRRMFGIAALVSVALPLIKDMIQMAIVVRSEHGAVVPDMFPLIHTAGLVALLILITRDRPAGEPPVLPLALGSAGCLVNLFCRRKDRETAAHAGYAAVSLREPETRRKQ